MNVREFDTPGDFLDYASSWLLAREIPNALVFGIAQRTASEPLPGAEPPFFAVAEDAGGIRLAAMRTPPWKAALCGPDDAPESLEAAAELAQRLAARYPDMHAVLGPPNVANAFANAWTRITGRPARATDASRVHQLTRLLPPRPVPGALRAATPVDHPMLRNWMHAFHDEAMPTTPDPTERIEAILGGTANEYVWIWENNGPACMCTTTRDTPNGRCIAYVYTPQTLRGQGYASALVAAVTKAILDSGKRFAYLYTDLANPTSNKIYAALGYEPVADMRDMEFD